MVDTLKLRLDVADVGGADLVSTANYLTNADEMINKSTGEVWMRGRLDNFRVYANKGCLTFEGSLPTLLYASNAKILTRHEVAQSLQKLSDLLHLPMDKARVLRLDCSYHWTMAKPIFEYIDRLGALTYFKRVQATANSLYYSKGGKKTTNTLLFYNKTQECRDGRKDVPDVYTDSLLLRYECRWLSGVSKQFGVTELKASALAEKPTYQMMVHKWSDYYFSINKSRDGAFNFDGVRDVRGAKNWLLGYLLSHTNASSVNEVLQSMKERKIFSDAKYYTRLRQDLREQMEKANRGCETDLIRELDGCVRNVVAYCR